MAPWRSFVLPAASAFTTVYMPEMLSGAFCAMGLAKSRAVSTGSSLVTSSIRPISRAPMASICWAPNRIFLALVTPTAAIR